MKAANTNQKTTPAEALKLLDEAWGYYTPQPAPQKPERKPELFEYANAA